MKIFYSLTTVILCGVLLSCDLEGSQASGALAAVKSEGDLRSELKQREAQNPSKYIAGVYKNWKNLINEQVIQGTLTNSADLCSFKDMVLEATCISKTETPIAQQLFTVYEVLNQKQSTTFKFKFYAPSATAKCTLRVVTATPLQ
jgi:hypothetical protein